jgi:flagellar basal body rod protein FlgG
LSGLQAGWIVDPKTGTIKKDTSQPKETVIKDKDGGFTVIQTPYTPDGVLDPSRQVTIKVDENGNTVSVTGVPANPSNEPGASNGASGVKAADQKESVVTDKELQEIKDSGDNKSYVTYTRNGEVRLINPKDPS